MDACGNSQLGMRREKRLPGDDAVRLGMVLVEIDDAVAAFVRRAGYVGVGTTSPCRADLLIGTDRILIAVRVGERFLAVGLDWEHPKALCCPVEGPFEFWSYS